MAAATKYAAAQIESEVDGKCCPMQKQSSADEEGYLITESDALEDWNVNVTYRTQNLQKKT